MKKALIVSPYLDHLGGGERYMLVTASVLESLGYEIFFSWDNLAEITTLADMLGIKLNNPQLAPHIKDLYTSRNPFSMYRATKPYDIVFYLSDGSLPLLGGKKNLVHMQVPFHGVGGNSLKNSMKKLFIHQIVVNSNFTKKVIDKEYRLNSVVLYPPVTPVIPGVKENLILSVGRFEPSLNTKHQDILIQAFRALSPQLPEWSLVLAGASSSERWITELKHMARGLKIEFVVNATHEQIAALYGRSQLYWHAAGYGIDEHKNPELTEHFGISTVEAISAKCLPLVVPYGGQREIVHDSRYHWETIDELITKTHALIKSPISPPIDVLQYALREFKQQLLKLI